MNKRHILIIASVAGIFLVSALWANAAQETVKGKLLYDQYFEYPYSVGPSPDKAVALEIDIDKNIRNKALHNLVGKTVQATGPARVINAPGAELHGLKVIDVRPGKGTVKALK
jgi:hypothetical protein